MPFYKIIRNREKEVVDYVKVGLEFVHGFYWTIGNFHIFSAWMVQICALEK